MLLPADGYGSQHLVSSQARSTFRHSFRRSRPHPREISRLAALGFLGLGARQPTPEWGLILSEGIGYIERAPWAVLAPASALILASVLATSLASLPPRGLRRRTPAVGVHAVESPRVPGEAGESLRGGGMTEALTDVTQADADCAVVGGGGS